MSGGKSQYMLLFYNDEEAYAAQTDDERKAIIREYMALAEEIRGRGEYLTGAPLHPTSSATTVRVHDGEAVVTDGPFAETKEQLGGFFLIEAASFDEASAVAARVPAARYGSVEVRPVVPVPAAVGA